MGKVVVGYRYFLGMHLGICTGPVDSIMEIRAGDRTAWTGSVTDNASISINAPGLFGGEEKEGGLQGTLDVMMGADTQATNDYLVSQHGADTPAYRGILSAVWRRGLVAVNNPYLKPWAFKVRRILKGWQGGTAWYSEKAAITLAGVGQGMNPAHIVYECITNGDWGMGYGISLIDDASFRAAADTFYAEGFGLCLQWTRQTTIEAFIQHVMDHAGAILTQDRVTGLFQLIPLRSDYTVSSLQAFDESNVIAVESYERPALPDAVNEVTVKYSDLATGADASITVQNLANITSQGGVVSEGRPYPGLPTGALATRVALRDLRAKSTPLAKVRFKANRTASNLLPGKVIKLSWSKLGIDSLVLRVLKVNAGTVVDGAVTVEAAEDVFGLPASSYATQPPTGWTDPSTSPAAVANRVVREATYYETLQRLGSTDAAALPSDASYVMAAATRPSGDSLDFGLNSRTGTAAFEEADRGPFAPGGALLAGIDQIATSATLTNGVDLDLASASTFAQVDNEIIRIDTINAMTGAITFGRGVLDTVAATHAAGARVYFLQDFAAVDETQRVGGDVVDVRLTPRTGRGELDVTTAPTNTVNVVGRLARPYPPGKVRLNGNAYPSEESGAFALTWAHRSRLQQNLEGDESGNIGPEAGTTYSVEIRNTITDAVIASATGITGTAYGPTLPGGTYPARVKLWSMRSGLASFQQHDFIVSYTAPAPGALLTAAASIIPGTALLGDVTVAGRILPAASSIVRGGAYGNVDPYISDVILLLHLDGSNGSTIFTDSSQLAQTPIAVGNAQITTAQSKFGGASLTANGVSYLQVGKTGAIAAPWQITGDFTIEGWARISSTEATSFLTILSVESANSGGTWAGFSLRINNQNPNPVLDLTGGPFQVSIPIGGSYALPAKNAWFHFAMVVEGGNLRFFLNGQSLIYRTVGADSYDWQAVGITFPSTGTVKVGASNTGNMGSGGFWLDEVRVSKRARYTGSYAPIFTVGTSVAVNYDANFVPQAAAFPGYTGGADYYFSSVVLLLHADGTNGSTTVTDSSPTPKTMTVSGNANISTAQSKFGGASLAFDGSGDWVQTTSNLADFRFGTGDFTVEAFVNTSTGNKSIFDFYSGSVSNCWQLFIDASGYLTWYSSSGSGAEAVAAATTTDLRTGTWRHVAACRSGSTLRLFVDGALVASATDTRDYNATAITQLAIGAQVFVRNAAYDWNGYIDEVRITKGAARYLGNFATPSAAFPDGSSGGGGGG